MPIDAPRCYAIRRVNPFLGVLQVIETSDGRAVSSNGVVWDIEVRAERKTGWGGMQRREAGFYRYGLWSAEEGLVNRPLAPHRRSDPFTQQCRALIDCVRERLDTLPFELADCRELWLFDPAGQPLALLASMPAGGTPPSPLPKYWSACHGADGVPSQRRFPGAGELEERVRRRAGFNVDRRWVTRQADGGGLTDKDEDIAAERFPVLLLNEDWEDDADRKLVGNYLEWIAPSLLTLQHLDRGARERLEQSLPVQAVSVEHHWHLYPEFIDEERIRAARVQCRLQQAGEQGRTAT